MVSGPLEPLVAVAWTMQEIVTAVALPLLFLAAGAAFAETPPPATVVRIAELEIDPAQLGSYTAAVREEMEDAVRIEPGVLAIYCVAEKDDPTRLRFFEIYASEAAYRSHLQSPHFLKYATVTKPMIRSRKLIETAPVQLSAKGR
jgi:quinol monooxygenase YgiN